MKKCLVPVGLACVVALLSIGHSARADEITIKVRNVAPRWLVWWLDAAHQPRPYEVAVVRDQPDCAEFLDVRMPQETLFKLPAGVEKLAEDAPQNSVRATGTSEGLAELRKQIAVLDRPLRQVEIEVQLVEVNAEAVGQFGIDLKSPFKLDGVAGQNAAASPFVTAQPVRMNFHKVLKDLETAKRAKVVTAPRLIAVDYVPAAISTETAIPMELPGTGDGLLMDFKYYASTRIGFTALPMVQADETILLRFSPTVSRGLRVLAEPQKAAVDVDKGSWVPLVTSKVMTTAKVRDGDTIAMTGLVPAKTQDGAKAVVYFMTARIVRYAEDPAPSPGP